ncbi:uncharacterized protein (TIGR00661 family) [Lutibacter sp. Hel_I_33_5]|uniref:glycosyltransferase n=1 Tax=Lutibacter sp. Hel_I_33_5 TaxID=1566289 RepID=UPI0011A9876B|nr:glycosyltransferase [Lutibacter sp. Hel_I_33_5]TVZ56180.1 uncharacterized protein (TIGR00661 family) [Lutibacter sp. Hel_I_33_5]
MTKKKIIVAPLNWGLGHATRSVPIIESLIENRFTPIIASDDDSLQFLKKEFSSLETIQLPSYHIKYGKNLRWNLLLQTPKILKAIKKEEQVINNFINADDEVIGIISDNRFGVTSDKVKSVYITHQLQVLSGITTFFTSKIHQKFINKFDECWIPDTLNSDFSGTLSQAKTIKIPKKYIGVLSRFKKETLTKEVDILIILSGPEPNRSKLEYKLIEKFSNFKGTVVLVQGNIESQQKITEENNITIFNYVLSSELEKLINQSEIVVCRSGYSSIMDLAVLNKKAFFIPTKNQSEQEYLAKYMEERNLAPFCKEDDFSIEKLAEIKNYEGLKSEKTKFNSGLFSLFQRK